MSDSGDQAVHELATLREIPITETQEVMTGDHDATTRPAFE